MRYEPTFDVRYLVLSDSLRFTAITLVAPGVRFNALAIFRTPCLFFAIDLNVRRSSLVHGRLTTFFFLAMTVPFSQDRAFIMARLVCNAPSFTQFNLVVAVLCCYAIMMWGLFSC
jgi:hypothetical protein